MGPDFVNQQRAMPAARQMKDAKGEGGPISLRLTGKVVAADWHIIGT